MNFILNFSSNFYTLTFSVYNWNKHLIIFRRNPPGENDDADETAHGKETAVAGENTDVDEADGYFFPAENLWDNS